MPTIGSERGRTLLFQSGDAPIEESDQRILPPPLRGLGTVAYALILGAFWIGAAAAFLWGYFGPNGLAALAPPFLVLAAFAAFMPPLLMVAGAWALSRGQAMARATEELVQAANSLLVADETASRTAARLGRVVRRELDGLNAGLDGAFTRLRALETVLENQISALDEASARTDVRAEAAASRLAVERERLDALAGGLTDAAARASELVAGRAAQLKANIESAEGALKAAGVTLDGQIANFRTAAEAAAEAPHAVALELDRQSKRIEQVSDATIARAEFVLGRQERNRAAMLELVQRLRDDGAAFENAIGEQRAVIENAIAAVETRAQTFEQLFADADRHLELLVSSGVAKTGQLTAGIGREVERLREMSDGANAGLSRITELLREAGVSAQTLLGETAAEAKTKARSLVGDAMAECEKLLRAAGELANESRQARETLNAAVGEMQNHLLSLPAVAKQEAQRIRELVRLETDEILDLSARTLSTIHARSHSRATGRLPAGAESPSDQTEGEGLLGLARRLTQRPRRKEDAKSWEMSTLLAAAETNDGKTRSINPDTAASLAALQAVLSDLAIDLDAMAVDGATGEDEWRRYLAGDRSVFARRLVQAIDASAVDRITKLYRENARFRDAADFYISEFESLLAVAREGDGGLLASTILSADTGKIYLALAYALGRLA